MAITSAQIEANGWVLALIVTGSPGNFASYALDPDGSPRVALAAAHAGFVKSAGQAVAGTINRSIVATKPLRLPVNRTTPLIEVIDETNLGGGLIRVRLALSEFVYATDSGLTLAVLAGWRSGESAASGIAVTNTSTTAAPIPIMRWGDLQYQQSSGTWQLALVVASHHPVGFEPVAGVRFSATDGTTTKTVWTTTLGWHGTAPDRLRCYTVTIDPATATALTAGLIRCDAEVYPWLGSMRTTDASGIRTMTGLPDLGRLTSAVKPFVVAYDPTGSVYAPRFVYVDPAGTTTASAAMVQTTLAGAKAVAVASRAATVLTAIQALYLANRTLPAANGQVTATRSGDGAVVVLAPGLNVMGTTSPTVGFQTPQLPLRIIGDPDDSNPRANCILRSGTVATVTARTGRIQFENMTCETGQFSMMTSATIFTSFSKVTVRGKPGFETSSAAAFSMAASAPNYAGQARDLLWWRTGVTMAGGGINFGFVRFVQHPRAITAPVVLNYRAISAAEDGTAATLPSLAAPQNTNDPGAQEDVFWAYNDLRSASNRALFPPNATAAVAGTPNASTRRWVLLNNVFERTGDTQFPMFTIGESESRTMSYNIVEGNTFAGNRTNFWYNDPAPVTYADIATFANQAFCNRVANNAHALHAIKQDDTNIPTVIALRIANGDAQTDGYRPHLVDQWSALYGAGYEANVDGRLGLTVDSFRHQFYGRRSLQSTTALNPAAFWTDDRSSFGTNTGGGDYTPSSGSALLGRVQRASSDVDRVGTMRTVGGASGAIEMAAPPTAALVPAAARSLQLAGTGGVVIHFALTAANSNHRHAAGPTLTGWASMLVPGSSVQTLASTVAPVSTGVATALLPNTGVLQILPELVILFPDRPAAGIITLSVPADLRTLLVK